MTKHIVGLIIFTLIVGTSVVIAGLFGYSPVTDTHKYGKYQTKHRVYKKKKRKKRCRKRRKPKTEKTDIATVQAAFDKNSNLLTTQFRFKTRKYEEDIDLHFFVNDEFGTQYLKKETILAPSIERTGSRFTYENSYDWLNRLESRENLYIMAIPKSSTSNFDYQPRFESSRATPVLLQSTK